MNRDNAAELDAADPLRGFRDRFVVDDPGLVYLDGNSLGRLPKATAEAMRATIDDEWGRRLVGSWSSWVDLPERVGDAIAPLIGAAAGDVLVADQTSVNLYKLATAALDATGRADIVTDDSNFPSDRYVLDAVAARAGGRVRVIAADPVHGPDPDVLVAALDGGVGLVSMSHVSFKSGAIADLATMARIADATGALSLWDLSHSVGVVPIDLAAAPSAMAVGCTYKYLNGGPGAPAFLAVPAALHERLRSPIPGWFGHDDMFAFDPDYRPAAGIRRFAAGTPPIVSLRGVELGAALTAEAGIESIRAKSLALTELLIERFDSDLAARGFRLGSPRNPAIRGGHVALRHEDGYRIAQALIDHGVVVDFRAPDTIRFGPAPLYTRHVDVVDAVDRLVDLLDSRAHEQYPRARTGVT